ncbi:hypothetical protein HHK36_005753 [Tetracentron sinense]|uniref:Exopolygalacturonase-like n=1 Tax=Tetracentron sinense TaxID=13715 RepID=A0A834ZLK2_TETSI|nr:hypothetical protein HHK36_005753 [Tetracentron sinense]
MMMGSSSTPLKVFVLVFLFVWVAEGQTRTKVFNVVRFGAVADGKTDNSKAFGNAWREACRWEGRNKVLIPEGTYMASPVMFQGPCKGYMVFETKGVVKAPTDLSMFDDSWITFQYINGLTISGGGTFDGQGASAWPYNQCTRNPNCKSLPVSIRFNFITNGMVRHISSIDSKLFHFNIFGCKKMKLRFIKISAPEDSPNTDGIHLGSSRGIQISRSVIGTGDDCISIGPGSKNIRISKVFCGPGHGISVGSLGKYQNEEDVMGIIVRNCTFSGTSNGVRIKTWAPSPASLASNFTFKDIFMNNVYNPIFIDQQYCPSRSCNPKAASQVQISDVRYRNIWGTSGSKLAVNLLCSPGVPCRNVELKDINLVHKGYGGPATSSCSYVNGVAYGRQIPPSCL